MKIKQIKNSILQAFIAIVSCLFMSSCLSAGEDMSQDPDLQWFQWKRNELEKEGHGDIFAYFDQIAPLFKTATDVMWYPDGEMRSYRDPKKMIEIVNESLEQIKNMKPPEICQYHYNLTIQILDNIIEFQEQLIGRGDEDYAEIMRNDSELDLTLRTIQLKRIDMEDQRTKEYFNVLKQIGFYDNSLEEMVELGLITEAEKREMENKQ